MGTARFLVYMTVFILAWIGWNALAPAGLRFDPYTFTFLTLILSLQASYAAPLILLAQNRQADRDRLTMEEDRRRAAAQKADTEYLAREIAALRIAVGEVATRDFLRSELARLAEELDDAAHRRSKAERKELRKEVKRVASATPDREAEAAADGYDDDSLDKPAPAPLAARPGDGRSIAGMSAPATTLDDAVTAALATVQDPEIRRPITELGMVRSVAVDAGGVARIGILLTVAGCPLKDKLRRTSRRRRCRCPASPRWRSTSAR